MRGEEVLEEELREVRQSEEVGEVRCRRCVMVGEVNLNGEMVSR